MTHHKNIFKRILIITGAVLFAVYLSQSWVPVFNGIDISHHNKVNWKKIEANDAFKFCYIKATEGQSFRDHMCSTHARNARKHGLEVGLYHYFRTDVPADKQFENFKSIYDKVPSNLIPAIDVEQQGNNYSNTQLVNERLKALIHLFEQEYGCRPVIYLGGSCCLKVLHTVYECPIWLRMFKIYHLVPNTAIKQTCIKGGLDMNYCKDLNKIRLKQP
jgi:lysozyme